MSKKNREKRASEVESPAGEGGGGMAWLPTVLALGALGLAFVAWTDAKRTRDELTKRIVSIDQRLIQTQTQVASARPKPPQQQGPDPSKVYTVRLDGSPYRGNPTAPIVIAEFSDYQ